LVVQKKLPAVSGRERRKRAVVDGGEREVREEKGEEGAVGTGGGCSLDTCSVLSPFSATTATTSSTTGSRERPAHLDDDWWWSDLSCLWRNRCQGGRLWEQTESILAFIC